MKSFFLAAVALVALAGCKSGRTAEQSLPVDTATTVKFSADSAFAWIQRQCDFGARTPGSEAHRRCGDFIVEKFKTYGLTVSEQTAPSVMWDGRRFTCRNIIAAYRPEATDRIIICTHWDSRPWADADPDAGKRTQPVMAANDGASGVAVMLEVARKLAELQPNVGIDFICFDLEDYGAPEGKGNVTDQSDWCIGSQYWAAHPHRADYRARYGILLDMVGGKDARFHFEGFSMKYAQAIVAKVWGAAQTAGYGKFFPQKDGGYITDDHVPMNEVAGIPTIDIIPFYPTQPSFGPTWHTVHDTPENISKETLEAVGQTLLQVISQEN